MKITRFEIEDLRFPTSLTADGTDAVHKDPDYSAAYVVLETDAGVEGHGLAFTLGRGNEICIAAIHALRPLVVGQDLADITTDFAGFWRRLASDSQLRWLGPEKGVIHLALAAIVNAVWDLYAKAAGKPLWKLLADMTPAQIVSCIDFRYITDALTPGEALAILERHAPQLASTQRETQWFVPRAAALFDAAVTHAWDDQHGGLVYGFAPDGRVCDGDKYFWVQAESLAAAALLAQRTGEDKYWQWYERIWDYSWKHLVDHEFGAWYRILTRDNRKYSDEKSPAGKTDYHTMGACYEVLNVLT